MDNLNFFKSFLEAEGDPPDAAMGAASAPPDIPDDVPEDAGPPDISDTADDSPPDFGGDDTTMDDAPPDFGGEDGGDDFGTDDMGEDGSEDGEGENTEPMGLDEKVSAIMNKNLYSRFLTMLDDLGSQLTQFKNNSDIIYTLSAEANDMYGKYKELDENIRLYLKNSFIDENYSKNLLFFNKCLNLFKLLNDSFSALIHKGINERK